MTKFYSDLPFSMVVKIGTVSGLVGGFAIFLSIFMIDLGLNAGQGAFYKVVGLPLGITGISATLVGMISHMLTAALVGTVFGMCSGLHQKLRIISLGRGIIAGITTGVVVFFAFFIPISSVLMIPTIQSSNAMLIGDVDNLLSNTNFIMLGALELHVVYGIAMGGFFAIAIQYESKRQKILKASV
ncbi:hypothetical protein [Candidatus Nitrosotenuis sp. DW1]|uniref:hypothetical protein n=1 Tax=Candidatus Nitrosotenuis sp. DW1 TaxID=2259672 RepID=UPI0015C7F242|nr:hypothetical protein [Candidatus Nitrosotenuis sp. DW1]QLH08649.1 hypothetical protein DSQ19_03355 [Candidatus Nitrosotenuis sp. DW1]